MKNKIPALGSTLFVLFALPAVTAGAASAEEALWLVSGGEVMALTSVETIGEFLWEDSNAFGGKEQISKCSSIYVGSIGPGGEVEMTEILTLSGMSVVAKKLGATGTSVACEPESICSGPESVVWPNKLPFKTQLELMSNGQILNVYLEFGWTILCLVLGINEEDECTGTAGAFVENMAGSTALWQFNSETEGGNCQIGGAGVSHWEGSFEIKTLTGLEVTADSL